MDAEQKIKQGYLTLGKPIWQMIKESQPERRALESDRIKDLLAQREAIDWELEIYGHRVTAPAQNSTPQTFLKKWQYSMVGFHNPIRHKNLTPVQFYEAWVKRAKSKGSPFLKEVLSNKKEAINFIKSKFSGTLKLTLLFVTFVPR